MEQSMTPLRQRMIEDMQVRNLARHTQRAYLQQISLFARHFGKSPDILGPADIRAYQLHLSQEKRLSASSILVAVAAIRFLYKVTLGRGWSVDEIIPACRKPQKLPAVLSQDEVARFLDAVDSRKHRAILTICYAAGLRISEAVPPDASGDRQPSDDHLRGGGQGAEGSLRDALAEAAGGSQDVLARRPPEESPVSRRHPRSIDLDLCRATRL